MPTIRHSWQSLRASTTLNRRQPGESHACWIQAPYAGHPCLYTRAPRSACCCCFRRDSGGPTWQAPKNRVVSMVQSYKKSPRWSSTRMIHVPPKQQEQMMAGRGSGRPPWIRRFILESRPAIGSSRRLLEGRSGRRHRQDLKVYVAALDGS